MQQQNKLQLKKDISPYEKSNKRSSILQMINTILPFLVLWFLAYESMAISYWISIVFIIAASGFVIRTFIMFHDCCHNSFFKSKRANEIVGTIFGIITFVPYQQWRRTHGIHHATSSNLNKRGVGDVWILTVDEYIAASFWLRLSYRVYRSPFVMFGIGPIYTFLISFRFNLRNIKMSERMNTYITNFGIFSIAGLLCWFIGWQAFLLIQGPIFMISGAAGIWLFYVQHQFEDSYFEKDKDWDFVKAAVDGSSYYKLPKVLQWITGNIGFHHVHHLSPRIPNYHLSTVHEKTPALQQVTTLNLLTSLQSIRFRLWDEAANHFVSFKDIKYLLLQEKKRMILKESKL